MEQLFTAFGIEAELIVIQIINFVVLLSVLSYLLYKPVLKILNEREVKITQGIKDAEEAAVARESAEESRREVLQTAHKEAEEINTRAKVYADEKAGGIVTEAQSKADRVIAEANEKTELMKQQARAESESEIARLAILAAERVISEKV
ncbi:MAG: F0F1 ATP synthase subunit B [Candidatus Paceibacterota bacterium]